ncbi:DUF222 domain-containing protein [Diaminobutyricibacter sp. McL0608]|uniref:DUF222 domain-containing protein n=1 Tax=Leifsonia sp. McL0608 TaxID=3143537 RepID=UPI0031F31EB1
MTFPPHADLDRLAAAVEALRALEAGIGAGAGGGVDAGASAVAGVGPDAGAVAGARADASAVDSASLAGPVLTGAQEMVRSLAVLGAVRAAVDAVAVHRIAVLERERSLDWDADPVQAAGHPSVESLLAELWKTPLPAARQLCGVARATAPRHTLQGEELPAEFPDLAQALLGNGAGSEHGDDPVSGDAANLGDDARDVADGLRPRVSVEQAGAIIRELVKTGPGCGLDDRAMGERVLIEHAPGLTVEQLAKLAVQVRERLDQDGTEPREQMQRRRRSLTISVTRDGMTHINWYLDAESAGHVLPQLTAYVSQDYRASRDKPGSGVSRPPSNAGSAGGVRFQLASRTEAAEGRSAAGGADAGGPAAGGPAAGGADAGGPAAGGADAGGSSASRAAEGGSAGCGSAAGGAAEGGAHADGANAGGADAGGPATDGSADPSPIMPESRTLAQLRSDGAVDAFRHLAGCSSPATRPPVTMIVRVGLDDLRSGDGTAHIDETLTPVSAGTARRLAADAQLIPMVLGGNSEVLDLGRSKRLFTPAQKLALAERDDGCAWTGCPHPPSYAQAHHIRWWDRDTGPTDLDNGILLCSQHHHRVHDDGWDIHIRDNTPWFTPPAHHDPTRTPRRGGRLRLPGSAP